MASESELADLFLTLRAVTAPMLGGFAEVTSSGEEMVAALTAGLDALDVRIAATAESLVALREEMAGVGAGGAVGLEGAALGASTGAATAAAPAAAGGAAAAESAAAAETMATEAATAAAKVEASYGQAGATIDEFGNVFVKSVGKAAAEAAKAAAAIEAENQKLIDSAARLAAGADEAALQWSIDYQKMAAATAAAATKMEVADAKAIAATSAVGAAQDKAAGTAPAWQSKLSTISGSLLKVGLAGVVAGGATVKMAADYQTSTNKLVTSGGTAVSQIDMVRQGMLAMSGQVGVSANDLSAAMYKVSSAGYTGAAGLALLENAEQGAKAEGADGVKVADALSSAMRDYYPHAKSAADITKLSADVMSKMVAATSTGKMTFDELAGGLNNILPVAQQTHIKLSDVLGVLSSMTVHGIGVDQATQNISHAMLKLQNPTLAMSKSMSTLGLDSISVSQNLGKRGLSGTLEYLSTAVKKSMPPGSDKVILDLGRSLSASTPKVQALGNQLLAGSVSQKQYNAAALAMDPISHGQASAFSTLVNSYHQLGTHQLSGRDVMMTYAGQLAKVTGDATTLKVALQTTGDNTEYTNHAIKKISAATADAQGNVLGWSQVQGTFNQKLSESKSGLESAAISIGQKLLPVASQILDVIGRLTTKFASNRTAVDILAIAIGVMLAGGVVGAAGKLVLFGANMAKHLISPITGSIGLIKNFAGGLKGAEGAADTFGGKLGKAASSVGKFVGSLASSIGSAVKWAGSMIAQGTRVAVSSSVNAARTAATWLVAQAKMIAQSLAQGAMWVTQWAIKFGAVALSSASAAASTSAAWLSATAKMVGQALVEFGVWAAGMLAEFVTVASAAAVSALATAAAWIAANAAMIVATGGIVLAVGLLVLAAVWVVQHWSQVSSFFSRLWASVKRIFTDAVHGAVDIIKGWYPVILGIMSGGILLLPALIFKYWSQITSFISRIWDDVTSYLSRKFDAIVAMVKSSWIFRMEASIVSWFSGLPSRIGKWVTGWVTSLKDRLDNAYSALKQWVTKMDVALVNWMLSVPSKIGHYFADAGRWLLNAGAAIIHGLWSGISNAMGWLGNQISHLAGSIVSGFKGALGISSPSTVMAREIGQYLPAGIAQGITSYGHLVTNATRKLARDAVNTGQQAFAGLPTSINASLTPGRGGAALPAGGVAGAGGGVVLGPGAVQVTVMGTVQTEQALVRAVQQGILQLSGRNSGFGLTSAFQ